MFVIDIQNIFETNCCFQQKLKEAVNKSVKTEFQDWTKNLKTRELKDELTDQPFIDLKMKLEKV